MSYLIVAVVVAGLLFWGWKLTSRNAYESAEYSVLKSDGSIELRKYPDLLMATTAMSNQNDGSFGRLFRYISGGNQDNEKVAMTTPVFIEAKTDEANGQMGFVLPKKVADGNAPLPENNQVELTERPGGTFAVIRYSGRGDLTARQQQNAKLKAWIKEQKLEELSDAETASYDPPWTPGPLRRNEILIRVRETGF